MREEPVRSLRSGKGDEEKLGVEKELTKKGGTGRMFRLNPGVRIEGDGNGSGAKEKGREDNGCST
jgi:hypothetical protein